jgi:hypothetical protein
VNPVLLFTCLTILMIILHDAFIIHHPFGIVFFNYGLCAGCLQCDQICCEYFLM